MIGLRDTLLRLLPHATRPGLRRIGDPGPDDPVLLTGNYALTVQRLERALAGHHVWLLVASSNGINVWCAAGGGHLTHHDVIAAIRSSGISERVHHRQLILPQLAATGVEPRLIEARTGWRSQWGPAHLDDLPAYLRTGRVGRSARTVRFPWRERLEMATIWAAPLALAALVTNGLALAWTVGAVTAVSIAAAVLTTFSLVPWLRLTGPARWLSHAGTAAVGTALGMLLLWILGRGGGASVAALFATCVVGALLLSIDLNGTTPCLPSSVNTLGDELFVEVVPGRCTGAATCIQVCPRDVLRLNERVVNVARGDACILCGACIVQCADDALRFRFEGGRVVEPSTVRTTRLNLLGKRAVRVRVSDPFG